MHEIHGGGHIWNAWTHFNLEHGSLLIITVLRLDYPVDSRHGPAPSALPCASVPEFFFSFGGAVATLLEVLLGFGGTAAILSATVIVSL